MDGAKFAGFFVAGITSLFMIIAGVLNFTANVDQIFGVIPKKSPGENAPPLVELDSSPNFNGNQGTDTRQMEAQRQLQEQMAQQQQQLQLQQERTQPPQSGQPCKDRPLIRAAAGLALQYAERQIKK